MRLLVAVFTAAAILGLVSVEIVALVLAGLAFIVAGLAYQMASSADRSLRGVLDQQSAAAQSLVSAAADVDSKLRDDSGH